MDVVHHVARLKERAPHLRQTMPSRVGTPGLIEPLKKKLGKHTAKERSWLGVGAAPYGASGKRNSWSGRNQAP